MCARMRLCVLGGCACSQIMLWVVNEWIAIVNGRETLLMRWTQRDDIAIGSQSLKAYTIV